ncbi:MAG: hypothetical protein EBR82_79060, partial [Caulobacteraceae bacterium]|nr:hypothetical protein [Caulobacteraceae bacterium]
GYTDIDDTCVKYAKDLTEEEKQRFIIADNVAFGEWDWDTLANDWEVVDLEEWGLNIPQFNQDVNLDDFFEESNEQKEEKFKITLEYTEDDYNKVNEALKKHSGSKEQIIFKLLGL